MFTSTPRALHKYFWRNEHAKCSEKICKTGKFMDSIKWSAQVNLLETTKSGSSSLASYWLQNIGQHDASELLDWLNRIEALRFWWIFIESTKKNRNSEASVTELIETIGQCGHEWVHNQVHNNVLNKVQDKT